MDLLPWIHLISLCVLYIWRRWGLGGLARGIFRRWYKSLKLGLLVRCTRLDCRLFLSELLIRRHPSTVITKWTSIRRNLQTIILFAFKDKRSRYFWIFLCLLLLQPSLSLKLKRKRDCRWKLSFHALHRCYRPLWFNLNSWCLSFLLLLQGIVDWAKINKLLSLCSKPQGTTIGKKPFVISYSLHNI